MKQDNFPPACLQGLVDELYFPFIDQELSLTKKMKTMVRHVNNKAKNRAVLQAKLTHETSEVKTPAIKLLAMTNKPGPNGAKSLRTFETANDLLKPENLFCSPEEVIKLVGEDLQAIKWLNETSKLIQAAQRKLTKVFKDL
ncbi:hypothetical protein F3I16_13510 [Pseudomonas sp. L-22-4S-12]|uniref:hypothetical protein n=1 Tax=Pseudomonas sp. L-22-4S-12 TaxID=2610893 RepID=UPI0013251E9F|nr:hypothetical protein [Pseudomonas sp. L-22-4S-12]MWV17054.1 hypothetical protein [Pseudomonas sp. L-22-4S-12]